MAQTIKLKRSASSGATPSTSSLELGEVAINTYDGKIYIKVVQVLKVVQVVQVVQVTKARKEK